MTRSVLRYARELDLNGVSLNDKNSLPFTNDDLSSMEILHLESVGLTKIPREVPLIKTLNHLVLSKNDVDSLPKTLSNLDKLETLIARRNKLTQRETRLEHPKMRVLDLSYNKLAYVPTDIFTMRNLVVLSLQHNHIKTLPGELFMDLLNLQSLDLSHNSIETFPPQIRRLSELVSLSIAHNPLEYANLRTLCALTRLTSLDLSYTSRTLSNMPEQLGELEALEVLDLSGNTLTAIPACLYLMDHLQKLYLSQCAIASFRIPDDSAIWPHLIVLDLRGNGLKKLPDNIGALANLQHLLLIENSLEGVELPSSFESLHHLQTLRLDYNPLQTLTHDMCAGVRKIKKLHLQGTQIKTLPESIYSMWADIEILHTTDNLGFHLPRKPEGIEQYCSADFSRSGNIDPEQIDDEEALEEERDTILSNHKVQKYTNMFMDICDGEEVLGQDCGLRCWSIDNFQPVSSEETLYNGFYDGDAYIVLHTCEKRDGCMDWYIWYWVGMNAKMDKVACAAVHAVTLRNQLQCERSTLRIEQGDEPEEFLSILPVPLNVLQGQGTESSFYHMDEDLLGSLRMYRIYTDTNKSLQMELMEPTWKCLVDDQIYLVDKNDDLRLWYGANTSDIFKQKAKLLVQRINAKERKNMAIITVEQQGFESDTFVETMHAYTLEQDGEMFETSVAKYNEHKEHREYAPKLYEIQIVNKFLKVSQPKSLDGLTPCLLKTNGVFVLDCFSELFLWIGRRSTRMLRAAGSKFVQDLMQSNNRPMYAKARRVTMFAEPEVFKTKFIGWKENEDMHLTHNREPAVNVYTRATPSRRPTPWQNKRVQLDIDIKALFRREKHQMDDIDALETMANYNYDLETMLAFRFSKGNLIRVPETDIGVFYSGECYVFLCVYWSEDSVSTTSITPTNSTHESDCEHDTEVESESENDPEENFEVILYFWTGRDAPSNAWALFVLQHSAKLIDLVRTKYKCELEIRQSYQQRETERFLSHFRRKTIIYKGAYTKNHTRARLFQIRQTSTIITQRTIEIPLDTTALDSNHCLLLLAPNQTGLGGVIYVWIGTHTDDADAQTAIAISSMLSSQVCTNEKALKPHADTQMHHETDVVAHVKNRFVVRVAPEGGEHPSFLKLLMNEDGDVDWHDHKSGIRPALPDYTLKRLFRCSNRTGVFTVTELSQDFCQDDLDHNDCFLVDSRSRVYIWVGKGTSDVVQKLALKSAETFVKDQGDGYPRDGVDMVFAGKETMHFKTFFHGWWPDKDST
eukprot:CFRG5628T1